MSVQCNTYVMVGAMFDYDTLQAAYQAAGIDDFDFSDAFEPYEDSAFDGIHHHNGLCALFDGMNGKYIAIGRVLAKSDDHQGLDEPVKIVPPTEQEAKWLRDEIMPLARGVEFEVGPIVLSHYR